MARPQPGVGGEVWPGDAGRRWRRASLRRDRRRQRRRLTAAALVAAAGLRGNPMRPEADAKARFEVAAGPRTEYASGWPHSPAAICERQRRARWSAVTGSSYSRIQTRIFWASNRSTCTRFVLRRGSCGERMPRRAILFPSICGIVTSTMPELPSYFDGSLLCPRCRATRAVPCLLSRGKPRRLR